VHGWSERCIQRFFEQENSSTQFISEIAFRSLAPRGLVKQSSWKEVSVLSLSNTKVDGIARIRGLVFKDFRHLAS
jgi:hypothetical protein